MEQKELIECMAQMDIIETMIREKEAMNYIERGEYEDAIAFAMAAGFRMGLDAYKKKIEKEKKEE